VDIAGIKASTDEVLAAVPGLEGFIEGVRQKITDSVQQVVNTAMAGVADGISQVVRLGQSIDGATLTLVPSGALKVTVEAEIPTFKATVSMPLKPE